jgi:predicted ester cyclase
VVGPHPRSIGVDGYAVTGKPLVEVASAVYRVERGRIAEYWIQIDRFGMVEQLRRAAAPAAS